MSVLRPLRRFVLSTAIVGVAVLGTAADLRASDDARTETVSEQMISLSPRAKRTWDFEVPEAGLAVVPAAFRFDDVSFAVSVEGDGLAVDTDGDGATDVTVEGNDGFVRLRHGETDRAVRLVRGAQGWLYGVSTVLRGKIGRTRLQVIDRDHDGRFDGVGKDALILGRGSHAQFLSKTLFVDGELYSAEWAENGRELRLEPYSGETGVLDLQSGFESKGRLLSAVIRSRDGQHSFDLAGLSEGARLPAEEYVLSCGEIGLGKNRLRVRSGRMKPIVVAASATVRPDWGGEVRAEFSYQRSGSQIGFAPNAVWYYGPLGEEYHDWHPCAKSPEFTIVTTDEDRVLEVVKFPGSG